MDPRVNAYVAFTVPFFDVFMKRTHGKVSLPFECGIARNRNGEAWDDGRVTGEDVYAVFGRWVALLVWAHGCFLH